MSEMYCERHGAANHVDGSMICGEWDLAITRTIERSHRTLHGALSAEYSIFSDPAPPSYVRSKADFHAGFDTGIATAAQLIDQLLI